MKLLDGLSIFNSGLVLIYGLFLSVLTAGGWKNRGERRQIIALCPLFLLLQVPFWLLLGEDAVRRLYPLLVHLPLILILIFALKKPVGVSIVSVLTAYLCCQLPRWGKIVVEAVTHSALAGEVVYMLSIGPLFFLLLRCFVKPAHSTITDSRKSLLLFGSLPAGYYVFDYSTAIYSDYLYAGIPALSELLPTVLILFYVVFLTVYHQEAQKRIEAELETSAREVLLTQAKREMEILHRMQAQTAVYQHDMRHHLNVVDALLTEGKPEQALAYIRRTQDDITAISTKRFYGNDTVNLICSSFLEKAERMQVRMTIRAQLPEKMTVSDTELCAVLSNALENALNAVAGLEAEDKWVELYCGIRRNKLLIEVKNPYAGKILMEDGLPVASEAGHGLGCRSIRAIVQRHNGLYTFLPENGIFTMQVVLPGTPA